MGVRINGVWHEELADPGTGGSDEGAGRNFSSPEQYNQVSSSQPAGFWGENLNTRASTTGHGPISEQDQASLQQYSDSYEKLLKAVADRDDKAFAESIREFDLYYGLDQNEFQEKVRQFNESLGISQAGLTGVYQGQPTLAAKLQEENIAQTRAALTGQFQGAPTLAAQLQAAEQLGTYQGQPTLAAQQQAYTQGTGLVNQIAQLQANPFRQQAAMGQLANLLGGRGVSGFGQIGAVPGAGTGGLGYLQQMIDDIKSGGAANTQSVQSTLDAIPTPNKLNSVEFFRSPTTTQNLVLQGMQEKYGIDPNDALQQIKNTMPGFTAPATYGQVRRS